LFDNGVAFAEEGQHVAAEEEGFGDGAEDGKGAATRKRSFISVSPEGRVRK
jgi:hypothetical protein